MGLITLNKLKIEDLFSGLNPENEQLKDKKIELSRNESLDGLIREFEKMLEDKEFGFGRYKELEEKWALKLRKYSPEDIERLSWILAGYQDANEFDSKAGVFLSLVINQSDGKNFVVHTKNLASIPWYIGGYNTKNIIIDGNAGRGLGDNMKSGKITVQGNCDENAGDCMQEGLVEINGMTKDFLGYCMQGGKIIVHGDAGDHISSFMQGGELIVNGNCGDSVGWCMSKGIITINGNAGDRIGLDMEGGEIYLNGDFKEIAGYNHNKKGSVYHRGKSIIKTGKVIPGEEIRWLQWD